MLAPSHATMCHASAKYSVPSRHDTAHDTNCHGTGILNYCLRGRPSSLTTCIPFNVVRGRRKRKKSRPSCISILIAHADNRPPTFSLAMTILHATWDAITATLEAFAIVSSISLITFQRVTAYVIRVIRNSLFVSALEAVRLPMEMHAIAGWLPVIA